MSARARALGRGRSALRRTGRAAAEREEGRGAGGVARLVVAAARPVSMAGRGAARCRPAPWAGRGTGSCRALAMPAAARGGRSPGLSNGCGNGRGNERGIERVLCSATLSRSGATRRAFGFACACVFLSAAGRARGAGVGRDAARFGSNGERSAARSAREATGWRAGNGKSGRGLAPRSMRRCRSGRCCGARRARAAASRRDLTSCGCRGLDMNERMTAVLRAHPQAPKVTLVGVTVASTVTMRGMMRAGAGTGLSVVRSRLEPSAEKE